MDLKPSAARIDLEGQRVLVTGAGRGLGRGMVLAFAAWGADIGAADIDGNAAQETRNMARSASRNSWSGRMDVSNEADVAANVEQCWKALGGIDLLVNNAGVLSVSPVIDMPPSEWRRVIEVNATGVFLVTQSVIRMMIAAKRGGSVVSIASIGGKRGDPLISHYNASKFAVVGFTQALAQEVAKHDILINAVCPGVVETKMIEDLAHGVQTPVSSWIAGQAINRSQTPEDIAFAVAFLHLSRAMTGQAINVDGGTLFH
jgi:NAD(P)-dependent dehydrogenase (short-subunit alcohol dehydrogenase family)